MTKFLKLTNTVININHITRIVKKLVNPNTSSYTIYINELDLSGMFIFSMGWIRNTDVYVSVNSSDNPVDYEKIRNWLEEKEVQQFTDQSKDCL